MKKKKSWIVRQSKLLYYKIVREKASPEYIARGWAIGMFYGCLIPFGLQLVCSIPTAFILKGSKIGASVGTLLTNPVSIFFIYPAQCWVGGKMLGRNITYARAEECMKQIINHDGPWYEGYQMLYEAGLDIILAFFAGGGLLTLIMTPITYFFILSITKRYKALRQKITAASAVGNNFRES